MLGVVVHGCIAGTGLVIVAIPGIIVAAILHTIVHVVVPGIFIGSTQGEIVAHGVTQAHACLPWCVEAIIQIHGIGIATHGIIALVVNNVLICQLQVGSTAQREVVEHRRIDVGTDAERRICHRAEDNTQFGIIARTRNALAFPSRAVCLLICHIILGIVRVVAIVYIVQTEGKAHPYTVVERQAQVEIIYTDIALLVLTIEEGFSVVGSLVALVIGSHQFIVVGIHCAPYLVAGILAVLLIQFLGIGSLGRCPLGL